MKRVDLEIMGAGIFGLSVAWACLVRGATVRVVEATRVGAGSSGGVLGALAPHVPENWNSKKAFQFEGLILAEGWWTQVAEAAGEDPGYGRTGRIQPLWDQKAIDLATARQAGAKENWRGLADWRVVETCPWGVAAPAYLFDTLSARIHPRKAVLALATAIATKGGEIVEETTTAGPATARLWATGHAGLKASGLGDGQKGQAILLNHAAPDRAQLFVDGIHVIPHADGTVAVGSTSERQWESEEPDGQIDELFERIREILPELAGAQVLERWAGIRPRARTRAPVLGHWQDGYIANGGFKIGFGMAPMVGEVMADLILEDQDRIPDAFKPRV